jgi:hypothetical protein
MLFIGWRWTQQVWYNYICNNCTASYWNRIIILVNQVALFDFGSRRRKWKSIHKINREWEIRVYGEFYIFVAYLPSRFCMFQKTSVPHNPRWWGWAYFACSLPPSRLMMSKFLKLFFAFRASKWKQLLRKLYLAWIAGDVIFILCEFVFEYICICETSWINAV